MDGCNGEKVDSSALPAAESRLSSISSPGGAAGGANLVDIDVDGDVRRGIIGRIRSNRVEENPRDDLVEPLASSYHQESDQD